MGLYQIFFFVDRSWLVGRDFNVIAHNGERTGRNTHDWDNSDFADMMDCGLTDAGYSKRRRIPTRIWSITSASDEVFESFETIQPSAVSFFQELMPALSQSICPI
ncbi:Uncharacterized protein Adt_18350 [Abeliophyllum distichum]|uniref:Uncharacterized protein n=1 Tax=Abeliophyllum distichum TaxID=126358 RepID=A0ABD1TJY3_9LAMI